MLTPQGHFLVLERTPGEPRLANGALLIGSPDDVQAASQLR